MFVQRVRCPLSLEGRNAVIEAFRAGKPIDRLFIQDGTQDGPIQTIKREARKQDTMIKFVAKERLDQLSETGKHQGVIAYTAAYEYADVADILAAAHSKNEPPFIILLDNIEDPHNLGAIIRTANLAGAHGIIEQPIYWLSCTKGFYHSISSLNHKFPISHVVFNQYPFLSFYLYRVHCLPNNLQYPRSVFF